MYVCLCRGVSDGDIAQAIREGARSVADVARCTGAGTCCGTCLPSIQALLDLRRGPATLGAAERHASLSCPSGAGEQAA